MPLNPVAAEGAHHLHISAKVPAAPANVVRIHVALFVVTLTEVVCRLHSHSGAPRAARRARMRRRSVYLCFRK